MMAMTPSARNPGPVEMNAWAMIASLDQKPLVISGTPARHAQA